MALETEQPPSPQTPKSPLPPQLPQEHQSPHAPQSPQPPRSPLPPKSPQAPQRSPQLPGITADADKDSSKHNGEERRMSDESVSFTEFDLPDLSMGDDFPIVEEFLKGLVPPKLPRLNTAKKRSKSMSSDGSSAISSEPVVVSTSITTQNIRQLGELLQTSTYSRFRISSAFDYEPSTAARGSPTFTAIIRFLRNGTTVVYEECTPDFYPNKKMAKEVAAGMGIAALPSLIEGMVDDAPTPEEKLDEEDWISVLHIFCQARHVMPKYTHFAKPPPPPAEFSCEIVLPNELGIAGTDGRVFGGRYQYYRNKKTAKCSAAKEAVVWIRGQPEPFSIKDSHTKNTAVKGSAYPNKGLVPKGGKIMVPKRALSVETVTWICPRLGMSMPEYVITQDSITNSLYDIKAMVKRLGGGKNVLIGPIKGVHGKKNAKEKMATSILKWLYKEADKMEVEIVRGDTL